MSVSEPAVNGRVVSLEGGLNFRDVGGYMTDSGRRVRRGRVFRSATMGAITERDRQTLTRLGVQRFTPPIPSICRPA